MTDKVPGALSLFQTLAQLGPAPSGVSRCRWNRLQLAGLVVSANTARAAQVSALRSSSDIQPFCTGSGVKGVTGHKLMRFNAQLASTRSPHPAPDGQTALAAEETLQWFHC